jgi:outer membrane protein assembly factor BamB
MRQRSFKLSAVFTVPFVLALLSCGVLVLSGSINGPTASGHSSSLAGDKILIASGGQLVLIDRESKKVLWRTTELQGALSVAALPNGEFLVGEGKRIARVSAEGKLIARNPIDFRMTTDVRPLDDGRMLVSDGPAGTVVEIDWSGNLFWSVSKLHHPSEAVRLASGNTLVADGTAALKEFNPSGMLVQTTWVKQWAASVERLPNGKTLIGGSKFLALLDANGKTTRSLQFSGRVTCVQQLTDNEYLICEPDENRVIISDASGTVNWEATNLRSPWHAIYLR